MEKSEGGILPLNYVVQSCALELDVVRYGERTKLENRREVEREARHCLEQEKKMMKLVDFFMDFIK